MPVTVTQSTNFNAAFGFGIQRPNLTADPALPADRRTTARFFDKAAFTQATWLPCSDSTICVRPYPSGSTSTKRLCASSN